MYASWTKDPASVDSDVFAAMVYVLAENGDAELYKEFDNLRLHAATPQDTNRFMYALTSFTAPELVAANIKLALSGELRVQDAPYFLASLLGNEDASEAAWDAIKANWEKINEMWPANSVSAIFSYLSSLDSVEQEADVRAFFAANPPKGGQMKLTQGLEKLRINVLLRQTVDADPDKKLTQHLLPVTAETCIAPNPAENTTSTTDGESK
jgi:puromycin-sensitive aminopeptidase